MKYDVLIHEVLGGDVLNATGEEVDCPCPACGHEDKFYVNREKGVGYCQRCQYTGSVVTLVSDVENLPRAEAMIRVEVLTRGVRSQSKKHEEDNDDGLLRTMLEIMGEAEPEPVTYELVPLPRNTHVLKGTPGEAYLQERGFSTKVLNKYRMRWCGRKRTTLKRLNNHVLLPDYDLGTGDLRYWTSRYAGLNPTGQKTYNPQGPRKHILYGHFAVPTSEKCVVIVEGPLDAVALNGRGVALLGKALSAEQCDQIVSSFTSAIVCLDNDAKLATLAVAKKLREYGLGSVYVSHTGEDYGDPAEVLEDEGHKRTYELIRDNAKPLSTEIEMYWRLDR